MNEYEAIRQELNNYLKERFRYPLSLIGFSKEHVGHETHFVRLLTQIVVKYGSKYMGIELVNEKSKVFAEKLGFQ